MTCYIEDVEVDTINDVFNHADIIVGTYTNKCIWVTSNEIGLDPRCGTCWINLDDEVIIIPEENIDRYLQFSNFRNIPEIAKRVVGRFIILPAFNGESPQVVQALKFYSTKK